MDSGIENTGKIRENKGLQNFGPGIKVVQ